MYESLFRKSNERTSDDFSPGCRVYAYFYFLCDGHSKKSANLKRLNSCQKKYISIRFKLNPAAMYANIVVIYNLSEFNAIIKRLLIDSLNC